MKKVLLQISFIFPASFSFALQGGPDAYGYTWKDSNEPGGPAYSWFDISSIGTLVTGLMDDNTVGPYSLGGNFQFYGQLKTQIYIGSNGYVAFNNSTLLGPAFTNIPFASGLNDFITGMASDLNITGAGNPGQCFYYSNSDTFCVSYINVPFFTTSPPNYSGNNSFQIILNKIDSTITVNFQSQSGTVSGDNQVIGIENSSGTIGLEHSYNTYPPVNYSIKYYPPGPSSVTENTLADLVHFYPNPSNGIFRLSSDIGHMTCDIEIYNMSGEKVYSQKTPFGSSAAQNAQGDFKIDLSGQPQGIYFVNVVTEGNSFTKKVVIQ